MNPAGGLPLLVLSAALLPACGSSGESRGQQLYAAHGCAVCHGPAGRGDGPSARRLDRPPRDLANPSSYRNGAGLEEIAVSIRRGGGDGAMPAFRDITEGEAKDVAAWIVSRQSPARAGGRP
jgi:cytochrome c